MKTASKVHKNMRKPVSTPKDIINLLPGTLPMIYIGGSVDIARRMAEHDNDAAQ